MPPTSAGSSLAAPVPTAANPGGSSPPRSPSKGRKRNVRNDRNKSSRTGPALLPRSLPVQPWHAHVLAPSAQEYLVDEAVQGYGTEHFFACLDDDQRGPGASHQGGDFQRCSIGADDGQFMFLRGQALFHGAVGQFVQEGVGVFFVYHPGERWVVDAVLGKGHPQDLRARKDGHWSALAIYHDQSWQVAAGQELQGF